MKSIIKIILLIVSAGLFNACDFLDQMPDNRTEIDSKHKVRQLLVSGYSQSNYAMVAEMSSDNVVDNNSPEGGVDGYQKSAMGREYDEAFAWQDIISNNGQDSPYHIWNQCYGAIAVANAALEGIEKLEKSGINMDPEKGEALMIRAYHHFILVNIFCHAYKDSIKSLQDLGITYMKKPETIVLGKYDRGSVTETYNEIVKDFEAGINLVDESYYDVPKYHFNSSAAHAFGARLYLYLRNYDKVIYHADKVLGTNQNNAANLLFDAHHARFETSYPTNEVYAWIDAASPSNLLLLSTNSPYPYSLSPNECRYAFNRKPLSETISGNGPNWDAPFPGMKRWNYDQNLGFFVAKFMYLFEYIDKNAGIGFVHVIRREFTTNETLLCRAEAYLYKGKITEAVTDLETWTRGYLCPKEFTPEIITNFYHSGKTAFVKPLNNTLLSEQFIIPPSIEPFIHCVLHFRRIETLHDGLRWFDIKRYGIEITHTIGPAADEHKLSWNDDRRAIQLPQEVIVSGIEPNPRVIIGSSPAMQYSPGYSTESVAALKSKMDKLTATTN